MAGSAQRHPRARTAVTTAAVAVLAALLFTACGAKDDATTNTTPGEAQIGAGPLGSASPSVSAGATTTAASQGATNVAPTYPKDAKAYAQELLKAMAKPDYTRIGTLAISSALQQIKDSITTGGNPNSQWPYLACTANTAADQTTCVARNSHGDELTIKLNQRQLGFPTAVTEAPLDRTTYPAQPTAYVGALLFAYENGNQQRMVRLSSDTVATKIKCTFANIPSVAVIDGTYSKVTIDGQGGSDYGKTYEFKVLTQPGGKANAVKEALLVQC